MLFLKARDEALQIYGNPRLCAARRRTQILQGPCDWLIEFSSRAQRPIGIAQEFPGNNDRVRLSGANDVFGLNWRSDHPDRAGYDLSLAADAFGKRDLVTGANCAVSACSLQAARPPEP